jgi:predicted flap endonuclease-1-like 5' DNA nuclease
MTMNLDPQLIAVAIIALFLGLFIGFSIRAPLKRKAAVLGERITGLERERATLTSDRDRLQSEVKARDAQIRPLADELDKLRRDFAKSRGTASANDTATIDRNDLKQLKGVGDKFAERLASAGITRIDQIAGWSGSDIEVIDGKMGDFRGRIVSDQLVDQARLLHEGRITEYETRFGKLAG